MPRSTRAGNTGKISRQSSSRFGALLRKYRKHSNLTQERLAELAHVSNTAISNYERGVSPPQDRNIVLSLVRALVGQGGIRNTEEADELLTSVDFSPLSIDEKIDLFSTLHRPDALSRADAPDLDDTVPSAADRYAGLDAYFTNRDEILWEFAEMLQAVSPSKRLLMLYGIGGVGKSSLLAMFQRYCRQMNMGVGFASANSARSALDILWEWSNTLKAGGMELWAFGRAWEEFRRVHEVIATQWQDHTVSEMLPSSVFGSSLQAANSGMQAPWLQAVLSPQEARLVLEPVVGITNAFLHDLKRLTEERSVVLMVDTYEQIRSLDGWLSHVARRLPPGVYMVIAGREMIDWVDHWEGWLAQTRFHAVEPLSEPDSAELIARYVQSQIGNSLPGEQTERICNFSKGLPLAITTAVRLWVKYQVQYQIEDFALLEADVLKELVRQLRRGVSTAFVPILEAGSVVRYFNRPMLQALLGQEEIGKEFDELRSFPFVRPDKVGDQHVLRIHDRVREFLRRELQVDHPERFRALHRRAASYFAAGIETDMASHGTELEHRQIEHVLHLLQADEGPGLARLHMLFRNNLAHCRYDFCHALIDEVTLLHLTSHKVTHRLDYYRLALKVMELTPAFVENAEIERLQANSALDVDVQWEILLYAGYVQLYQGHRKRALRYLEKSLESLHRIAPSRPVDEFQIIFMLADCHDGLRNKRRLFDRATALAQAAGSNYLMLQADAVVAHSYFDCKDYVTAESIWRESLAKSEAIRQDSLFTAEQLPNPNFMAEAYIRLAHGLIALGRYAEARKLLQKAADASHRYPTDVAVHNPVTWVNRTLGVLEYAQGNYVEAIAFFTACLPIYRERRSINGRIRAEVLLAECEYLAGQSALVQAKRTDLDMLASRAISSVGEWVSRWRVLCGHLLLDEAQASGGTVEPAVASYLAALHAALKGKATAIDDTIERIFWRLHAAVNSGGQAQAETVLRRLHHTWQTGHSEGTALTILEQQSREDMVDLVAHPQYTVVERLESALSNGIPQAKPECWQGL